MRHENLPHNKKYFFTIVVFFAILYSSISLINHYFYRTYALDLGVYTNALYDYAHFSFNDSAAFKEVNENLLADHFDLFLPLVSQFSWIFGSYTLLLVQIIALLLGGIGVYQYFIRQNFTSLYASCAMVYFYSFFAVFSALSYDYHSNVIAACVLPWLLIFISEKKWWKATLVFTLIVITKENMSLWMIFVCGTLAWMNRKEKSIRKCYLFMTAFAAIYFVIVTGFIMPALSVKHSFVQFRYSALGHNYGEAIATIFSHPIDVITTLFTNHTNHPEGNGIKVEFWLFFLASGGLFLFIRPIWLVMLIPVFMQKLMHDQVQMWGINNQYCIEFAPVFAIALFSMMKNIHQIRWQKIYLGILMVMVMVTSFRLMDAPVAYVRKENIRFYQASHYTSDKNIQAIYKAISLIPKDASISAMSFIYPHISWRDKAYQFPLIKDAEYIIYLKQEDTFPLKKEEFTKLTASLEENKLYRIIFQRDGLVLLQRDN